MYNKDYIYGGVSIILRLILYFAIPFLILISIRNLIDGIKNKRAALIIKGSMKIALIGVMTFLCFIDFISLPVGIKTKNINNALNAFDSKAAGTYEFCYSICSGRVFIDEFATHEEAREALKKFSENYETDISSENGLEFSITSYECLRAQYKGNCFLGGISDEAGAWVSIIGERKLITICFSYFDTGIGSVFKGLIPLDALIRPKLDLEKVASNLNDITESHEEIAY